MRRVLLALPEDAFAVTLAYLSSICETTSLIYYPRRVGFGAISGFLNFPALGSPFFPRRLPAGFQAYGFLLMPSWGLVFSHRDLVKNPSVVTDTQAGDLAARQATRCDNTTHVVSRLHRYIASNRKSYRSSTDRAIDFCASGSNLSVKYQMLPQWARQSRNRHLSNSITQRFYIKLHPKTLILHPLAWDIWRGRLNLPIFCAMGVLDGCRLEPDGSNQYKYYESD